MKTMIRLLWITPLAAGLVLGQVRAPAGAGGTRKSDGAEGPRTASAVVKTFLSAIKNHDFRTWVSSLSGYERDLQLARMTNPRVLWKEKEATVTRRYAEFFQSQFAIEVPVEIAEGSLPDYIPFDPRILFVPPKTSKVIEERPDGRTIRTVYVELQFERGQVMFKGPVRSMIISFFVRDGRFDAHLSLALTTPSIDLPASIVEGSFHYYPE